MLRISYELDKALRYRQASRIFGNMDNDIRPLSVTEIVGHELDLITSSMKALFEVDSKFYERMK